LNSLEKPKITFSYKKQKEFEKKANQLHYPYLILYSSRRYSYVRVVEVKDKELQSRGIDIKLLSDDGGSLTIELKTDTHVNSPNIFLEHISNNQTGEIGCTLKCESEVLSYGYFDWKKKKLVKLYLYDMQGLRDWFLKNMYKYIIKRIRNEGYDTFGCPVPRKDIKQFLIVKFE